MANLEGGRGGEGMELGVEEGKWDEEGEGMEDWQESSREK